MRPSAEDDTVTSSSELAAAEPLPLRGRRAAALGRLSVGLSLLLKPTPLLLMIGGAGGGAGGMAASAADVAGGVAATAAGFARRAIATI